MKVTERENHLQDLLFEAERLEQIKPVLAGLRKQIRDLNERLEESDTERKLLDDACVVVLSAFQAKGKWLPADPSDWDVDTLGEYLADLNPIKAIPR